MNILLFGSLFPYEDRVLAMTDAGHRLVYARTTDRQPGAAFAAEIPCHDVRGRDMPRHVRRLCAEHDVAVIYSLLNCYGPENEEVAALLDDPGPRVPIVRHYKEHRCRPSAAERRALTETAGQIYINEHSLRHFRSEYDVSRESAFVADADRLSERFMTDDFAPRLRDLDGRPHVLIAGTLTVDRGRHDHREFVWEMARRGIAVHLYGSYLAGARTSYEAIAEVCPAIHLHDEPVPRERFTEEWSRYDAGVLHARIGPWNEWWRFQEVNYPYRFSAYLGAGLPLLQQEGGQRAMCDLVAEEGLGIVWRTYEELAERLFDDASMCRLRKTARRRRREFAFERDLPTILGALEGCAA